MLLWCGCGVVVACFCANNQNAIIVRAVIDTTCDALMKWNGNLMYVNHAGF